jgi:hypothetical protein
MKLLLLLLLSTDLYANTNLDSFFKSNEAKDMCLKSSHSNGRVRRTSIKFLKHDEQSLYYASSLDGFSRVIEYAYDGSITKEYTFEGSITDIAFYNDEVIFLLRENMYVVNKFTKKLIFRTNTLPAGLNYSKYGNANGVYVYKDIYYIAHGKHGIIPFDKKLNKHLPAVVLNIPQPQVGHKSMITDIVGGGSKVYFTLDDLTLSHRSKAFEGLMIYDLDTQSTLKTIPVNQGLEAYYMSNLSLNNDELVITNLHLNFIHKFSKLERSRYMKPQRRIWKYSNGKLLGRAIISGKKLYGCFLDESANKLSAGIESL